jgi:chromosome segregation ATPase
MDNDQLVKRVEWLDKERLDDKNAISESRERINTLEVALRKSTTKITELTSDITRLNVIIEKVDKFEGILSDHNAKLKKEIDSEEKRRKKRDREAVQKKQLETDAMNKKMSEFREGLAGIVKTKKELTAIKSGEEKLAKSIAEVKVSMLEIYQSEEERNRMASSWSEAQQKDVKRMADLQGEISAMRKRQDENAGRMELVQADKRKTEARLNEIQAAEVERREAQISFIDQMTSNQDEHERKWKGWNERFDTIEKQSEQLSAHLKNISDAEYAVQKAQAAFEEITDQLGRRIKEIMEMQRLGEERFRQEFATFKADDQKRWTNHMLTQEELQRENGRQLEKLSAQTTNLEDSIQEMQDILQHLSDQTEKRLQTTLANMREWIAENDKFLSSMR